MNKIPAKRILIVAVIMIIMTGFLLSSYGKGSVAAQVTAIDFTYTTDADFDLGTLISVNHDAPFNDQLQLDSPTEPFPFINVAASGRGTVVRSNTETGEIVGEYRTAPEGRGLNPSRTTVDLFGNVWTANRGEVGPIDGVPHGSAVKIGLIAGGTRVDGGGSPDPGGGYLAPPFGYNTCVDRDGDGLIRTSTGLGDVLAWPDITDGFGGADGLVEDAEDECILIYQRLYDAEQARHVSVDADNNVWVGGYPFDLAMFYKLGGVSGAILDAFDAREIGCGGYGGLVDGNGILWSVGGALLRYDPVAGTGFCINQGGYGLGIDTNGYIWMSIWDGGIVKIAPDGTVVPGFPKHTYPPSMITSSTSATERALSPALTRPAQSAALVEPQSAVAAPAFQAAPQLAAAAPTFQVAPVDEWVQSSNPWTPGATISLTIEDGSGVIYSDSQTADSGGHFHFGFWDVLDLQRGHIVTVSDGTTTKTHTVANLYVDRIDITLDTVFGRASAGAEVEIWVHGDGSMAITADGLGNWTADFSALTDLTYLSDGGSFEADSDGDSTGVWWAAPRFWAAPDGDWVQSDRGWTPGATVSLTIEDGSGVLYFDSQTADGEGRFNFGFGGIFDLQRGHVVTVSDGTTTKSHTVTNLYVDGFDVTADTVFGRAGASTNVDVWVHDDGNLTVTADGAGNWLADFSGMTDLTYASDGGSQQRDDDGDTTGVWWEFPKIEVSADDDWVQSWSRWTAGATISLTIEDGSGVLHGDAQTADGNGNFHFSLWDVFDLQRGHIVTVSDGTTTKTHTVTNLYADGVDVTADTVFGRADSGTEVEVWVHDDGQLTVTADSSGNWVADFSGMTDLTYASDGGSRQVDADGDSTGAWWSSPRFEVSPVEDWVQSAGPWKSESTISLTIEDGSGVVYAGSLTANARGDFHFGLSDVFDIERGHIVTVSDGTTTKTHVVTNLYVDGVDVAGDTVFGRADPGTYVNVWTHDNFNVPVTADGSGNWTADFSGLTDITYWSDGGTTQFDDDGDETGVRWYSPRIQVAPEDDWVQSRNPWTPGATVSLTIEDGSGMVYSDSQTADDRGNFNFQLWDVFDLQRGHIVTVSDGTNTKTHTVTNLHVDGIDVTGDTVFGRADASSTVDVWVHDESNLAVVADGSGNWTADFSGMIDLTYASNGSSEQFDDEGDSTGVWWASPSFQVAPDEDWVQSGNRWTAGSTISLTIEDGSGVVYSDSRTADDRGYFNFDFGNVFDLQRGHVVTVSDGATTKTHTVIDLFVDGVDVTADTVFGRAAAGTNVETWVHGNGDLAVTADGSGNWLANYSGITDLTYLSDGGSQQFDDDGDSTGVWWATPRFQVAPDDNWVQSGNRWTPGATISLVIEDGNGVVYTGSQTADRYGNFNFDLGWFDLQPDHIVTVSDGITVKTHAVTNVDVINIDTAADQVHGTANPGAQVQVLASLFDEGSSRWVTADGAGNWLADFSAPAGDQPAYDITGNTRITVNEFDDDGDTTWRQFGPPSPWNRGVAVTPIDNHVWVANSGVGTVTRLDNDGNVLKIIATGVEPTGVAVDAAGKVWATNLGSDNVVRIDPNAGPDGLGAVDLTVDLGPGASPYNYSDMTGAVVVGSTSPQGFWSVIQDGQTPGFEWGRITWNNEPEGNVPAGTAIVVEARAADTEAGLGGLPFIQVEDDVLFTLFGRYIEVRATLKASPEGASPVLSDLRIRPAIVYVDIDIKPESDPNSINCLNKKESIAVAILTTDDFDALTVDHTTVLFQGAAEFHKVRGLPARHEEDVDYDGDMDLVLHFRLKDTDLSCDSVEGTLIGQTYSGFDIEGTDAVRMVQDREDEP